jgi:hypothetical protein
MPVLTEDAGFDFARLQEGFPSSVTITRTSQKDCKSRQLIVSIDGARVATLLWGDSISSELTPGPHTLRVSNTLVWKTVDFVVAPGEQVFFETLNRLGPGSLLCLLVLGAGPLYVTVRRMF